MKVKSYILIAVLLCLATLSNAQKKKNFQNYIEEFRPRYRPEFKMETQDGGSDKPVEFTQNIDEPMEEYIDSLKSIYQKRPILIRAHSVLVYNGEDEEEARKIRSKVLRYFPDANLKLDYVNPIWKLKVGPFRDKLEAVRHKEGMIKNGVTDVLIMPDNIRIEHK